MHPTLERIDRQTSILRDLDGMTILLQNLHGQLLIDWIVLSEENIEFHVVWGRNRGQG